MTHIHDVQFIYTFSYPYMMYILHTSSQYFQIQNQFTVRYSELVLQSPDLQTIRARSLWMAFYSFFDLVYDIQRCFNMGSKCVLSKIAMIKSDQTCNATISVYTWLSQSYAGFILIKKLLIYKRSEQDPSEWCFVLRLILYIIFRGVSTWDQNVCCQKLRWSNLKRCILVWFHNCVATYIKIPNKTDLKLC